MTELGSHGVVTQERIPPIAHFIWYGAALPWVNALALRSALACGGFERVLLHCEPVLERQPCLHELRAYRAFEVRPIDAARLLSVMPQHAAGLLRLYHGLGSAAARANLLRPAILAAEGGVYLDMDTVTLRSLSDLRTAGVFCGQEQIAFPAEVVRSRDPRRLAPALALHGLRALCRRHPQGLRLFRRFSRFYALAVNNAVLGAAPDHPLMRSLLAAMLALPRARQSARFALGTHLLQSEVRCYQGDDLVLHAPAVFYPLPPEISHHWFRMRPHAELALALAPETRVVHWYASVENRKLTAGIDAEHVRRHAGRQLFSALAARFVD